MEDTERDTLERNFRLKDQNPCRDTAGRIHDAKSAESTDIVLHEDLST